MVVDIAIVMPWNKNNDLRQQTGSTIVVVYYILLTSAAIYNNSLVEENHVSLGLVCLPILLLVPTTAQLVYLAALVHKNSYPTILQVATVCILVFTKTSRDLGAAEPDISQNSLKSLRTNRGSLRSRFEQS